MSTVYLFRVDGAKDNDDFFASMRTSVSHAYAGVDFRVGGAGWIPDLVRVVVDDPPDRCSLTLIELEATESVALISCRKYLPENSADILSAFDGYLDRVVRQCRSSADARETVFVTLKAVLSQVTQVTITTAGALRSSTSFVEELSLIDQPMLTARPREILKEQEAKNRTFHGILRLSAIEAKELSRCVMILDAVIRQRDHSKATLEAWRGSLTSQPLKRLLSENNEKHPTLRAFVFETRSRGITLDFELVLSELVEIWSAFRLMRLNREYIRTLVSSYYPIGSIIKYHEKMEAVFEKARKHVSDAVVWPNVEKKERLMQ